MTNANVTPISAAGQGGQQSPAYQLLSGKAYDPDAVYLDASDSKGHYEQVNVKLPPNVQHVVDVITEMDMYRSRQDFIRDALVHHCHRRLTELLPDDTEAMHLIELQASSDRMAMRKRIREERRANLEATRDMVSDLVRDRDFAALHEEMARVETLADDENLAEGVREEYAELWQDMSYAVQRDKRRKKNK